VGYETLDRLAERLGVKLAREKHEACVAEAQYQGTKLLLMKPLTFMNRSGVSVARGARNALEDPADLLVVLDDADLPLGRLRLRARGSAGGHNGLRSIIEHLGTQEFPRLRIGVGRDIAEADLIDHVLGRFKPEERPEVDRTVARAVEAILYHVAEGVESAMNVFNADPNAGADSPPS
jgi:PTH1 family peptidyl-tRNA hydrolase